MQWTTSGSTGQFTSDFNDPMHRNNSSLMSQNSTPPQSRVRGNILLDACHQFCSNRKVNFDDISQFKELFYSLIADTDQRNRKIISAILARNPHTPRAIAYYLAMEPIEIAAPFLLISRSLQQNDLVRLAQKLDITYLNVMARRSDLTPDLCRVLIEQGDSTTLAALQKNPIAKLNSLLGKKNQPRSAQSTQPNPDFGRNQRQLDREKLITLATGNKRPEYQGVNAAPSISVAAISEKMLDAAKLGKLLDIAKIIADCTQLPHANVEALIKSSDLSIYCLFLKALGIERVNALQIILLTHRHVGQDVAIFNQTTNTFDNMDSNKAQDILRNMGAKNLPDMAPPENIPAAPALFERAAKSRKTEIRANRSNAVFGRARRSA